MSEDYVSPGPKRTLKMVAINPEILEAADALAEAAKVTSDYYQRDGSVMSMTRLDEALAAYEKARG